LGDVSSPFTQYQSQRKEFKNKMAKGTQQQSAKAAAKKRIVKVDAHGDVHVTASFNNIIVVYTNKQGQVISWSSAGKMGFRGSN
jgi:small subunit ribosomal protein S11